jgi:hypothetical protein
MPAPSPLCPPLGGPTSCSPSGGAPQLPRMSLRDNGVDLRFGKLQLLFLLTIRRFFLYALSRISKGVFGHDAYVVLFKYEIFLFFLFWLCLRPRPGLIAIMQEFRGRGRTKTSTAFFHVHFRRERSSCLLLRRSAVPLRRHHG